MGLLLVTLSMLNLPNVLSIASFNPVVGMTSPMDVKAVYRLKHEAFLKFRVIPTVIQTMT